MGFIGLLRTLEAITRTAGHDDDRPLADDTPTPTDPGLDEECNCEPWLSDDELVAVRQLIDERFPIFAGAAASLADGSSSHPSVREDKQQEPTEPADPHKSSVETGHDIGLSWAAETFPQHTKSSASNHTGTGAEPAPSPTIVQSAPPPTVDGEGPSEVSDIPASPSEGRPTSELLTRAADVIDISAVFASALGYCNEDTGTQLDVFSAELRDRAATFKAIEE